MGIIKDTINNNVRYNQNQSASVTTAKIKKYDSVTNKATIQYYNPQGGGRFTRMNVPVANSLGGLYSTGLKSGSVVSIQFRNNNIFAPVITGELTNHYTEKNFVDQGGVIVDSYLKYVTIPEEEEIIPMSEQWFDENEEINSHITHHTYTRYISRDIELESMKLVRQINHFSGTEQGVVHLDNNSCIRFKDNGDIDVFTGNNTGIRISKKTGIEFYGKFNIPEEIASAIDLGIADEIIQVNTDSDSIKEYSKKIIALINDLDLKIKELMEVIEQLIILTGSTSKWQSLIDIINRFEEIKIQYLDMVVSSSLEEFVSVYEELLEIKEIVDEEYETMHRVHNDAQGIS